MCTAEHGMKMEFYRASLLVMSMAVNWRLTFYLSP